MTDHVTTVAVQNVPLLQVLKDGGAESPGALAEKAGVLSGNVHRKLDALEEDGLIVRQPGAPKHEATLSQKGEAALAILSIRMIPASQVVRWADNPRSEQTLNDDELQGLARSIGDKGVLQPIIVRPLGEAFEVIVGDRRRRAAQIAVRNSWQPADFLIPARVRQITDEEAVEIAGVENIQREDMHWMDEAKWFLRLSARLSASAIERLIGGGRKKRSIQDYTKIARELPPEEVARCYLPDSDPNQLTYVKARDLVGDKKEKPALELSPRVALTLVELMCAGAAPHPGAKEIVTKLQSAPAGGPMATLAEKKLVVWRFVDGTPAAVIPLSEDLRQWLAQTGYANEIDGGLHSARVVALGELQASTIQQGAWVTPELNAPEPVPAPEPPPGPEISPSQRRVLREIAARSLHRHRLLDGYVLARASALEDPDYLAIYDLEFTVHRDAQTQTVAGMELEVALTLSGRDFLKAQGIAPDDAKSANSCTTPWLRTDQGEAEGDGSGERLPEIEGESAQDAEPGAPEPAPPAPAAPPAVAEFDLPPMLAIVAVELAHKIATGGVEKGPETWVAPIRESYYKDTRGAQGVQKFRAWAFMPYSRDVAGCAMTARSRDWLVKTFDLVEVGDGRLILDDELLQALQAKLGFTPVDDGPYATFWLNPVSAAAAAALAPAAPLSPPPAAPTMGFSDHLRAMGAEDRVRIIERLCGALKESRRALSVAGSRRLNTPELNQYRALIDSALEAAGAPTEDA